MRIILIPAVSLPCLPAGRDWTLVATLRSGFSTLLNNCVAVYTERNEGSQSFHRPDRYWANDKPKTINEKLIIWIEENH